MIVLEFSLYGVVVCDGGIGKWGVGRKSNVLMIRFQMQDFCKFLIRKSLSKKVLYFVNIFEVEWDIFGKLDIQNLGYKMVVTCRKWAFLR